MCGRSIGFYSALFATRPPLIKADYANLMLDDPRVNFAIGRIAREGAGSPRSHPIVGQPLPRHVDTAVKVMSRVCS